MTFSASGKCLLRNIEVIILPARGEMTRRYQLDLSGGFDFAVKPISQSLGKSDEENVFTVRYKFISWSQKRPLTSIVKKVEGMLLNIIRSQHLIFLITTSNFNNHEV